MSESPTTHASANAPRNGANRRPRQRNANPRNAGGPSTAPTPGNASTPVQLNPNATAFDPSSFTPKPEAEYKPSVRRVRKDQTQDPDRNTLQNQENSNRNRNPRNANANASNNRNPRNNGAGSKPQQQQNRSSTTNTASVQDARTDPSTTAVTKPATPPRTMRNGNANRRQEQLEKDRLAINLAARLTSQLRGGSYECMICYDIVRAKDPIWSCSKSCFAVFHAKCIRAWASSSSASSSNLTERPEWRCPGCQYKLSFRVCGCCLLLTCVPIQGQIKLHILLVSVERRIIQMQEF
ncbi:UNVERIFIED_CONTAM: hypothetical protein HDU68_006391 [Siphonaria sp. JEL0065]|nr:hypothetical protein HDU68_006391 [Siphonaria sp. JEL0065]